MVPASIACSLLRWITGHVSMKKSMRRVLPLAGVLAMGALSVPMVHADMSVEDLHGLLERSAEYGFTYYKDIEIEVADAPAAGLKMREIHRPDRRDAETGHDNECKDHHWKDKPGITERHRSDRQKAKIAGDRCAIEDRR